MKIKFTPARTAFVAMAVISVFAGIAFAADKKLSRAEMNYQTYCWQCHGMTGNGKGVNSSQMSVQPRDHTDPVGMKGITDEQMFKAIKEGGLAVSKSVLMPSWGSTFSDDEIKELVAHLRNMCKCKPGT